MTKTPGAPALPAAALALPLAALLALAPPAAAHGAPPVREVDARVLLDDDGLGYGGCVEGACPPGAGGGLDLLALDVREAWLGGQPAVVFRILFQSAEPAAGGGIVLAVEAPGGARQLRADTADGLAFVPTGFDRLDGPFDVGDGHPKALDGWVLASALGAAEGDALSGLSVATFRGEAPDDAMPGGWFVNGVEVQVPPSDGGPGTYTLAGPATLVALTVGEAMVQAHGPARVTLELSNAVGLPQFADLAATAPAGVRASLASAGLALDGGASRTVELTVHTDVDAVVEVVATTDLGGRAVASIPVSAPDHGAGLDNGTETQGRGHTAAPAGGDRESPGPGAALAVAAALAPAALALRRRR
jgi:hypothetical protein